MIRLIRWLLLPVSFLYAGMMWLRNRMYDLNLLKSTYFKFPVVVIGNLAVGGTGKSPMTEYVLRIVLPLSNVGVLSRGYGRKTKGFREVSVTDVADESGDEPLQIKRKFPETTVVVCENRVKGIQQLLTRCAAILLDDAYQHRALKPSFSILLFDYRSLLTARFPLPTGSFRDGLQESNRANCIVVTKCPEDLDLAMKSKLTEKLRAFSQADIFFAKIAYDNVINPAGKAFPKTSLPNTCVLLVTGIANPQPLTEYLLPKVKELRQISYNDHHDFSAKDLDYIGKEWTKISDDKKIIITTEKDMQRFPSSFSARYPIYFIPIQPQILFGEAPIFENIVRKAFRVSEM
ncbi:tetraacyldisaccharide 4'-kinase [Sphingobacterium griseoflavum]|uniref:Tetraacyldisaccharide 4'-kinase n=1 Tax=Sphingobacterium griseoflavum TaxID=1474952 RepID=A0ABQ3HUB9_9SPHI|nr:tetraacyldisaccharide 4'-kinase [Sphingobacterium griseoflavum]GHE29402.1 tetraacyldisaccharide 4'-kinase [Sphingobacterium griseoflavum]